MERRTSPRAAAFLIFAIRSVWLVTLREMCSSVVATFCALNVPAPGRFPKRPGAARAPQFRGRHAWRRVCKSLPNAVATRIPAIPRDWFYSATQFSIKENKSRRRPKP